MKIDSNFIFHILEIKEINPPMVKPFLAYLAGGGGGGVRSPLFKS